MPTVLTLARLCKHYEQMPIDHNAPLGVLKSRGMCIVHMCKA